MTNPPSILTNGSISAPNGCSSIADANGNLLFYTDGFTIWNASHSIMANGSGLLSNVNSAQGCIILRQPGSNLYYVFHTTSYMNNTAICATCPGYLFYTIVDMNLSAGSGSVTTKNAILYTGSVSTKLAAVKHCNNSDIWLVNMDTYGYYLAFSTGTYAPNFRTYLLSSTGINTTAVVSPASNYTFATSITDADNNGSIKISPNGKKLGIANYNHYYGSTNRPNFELYDFDNTTGIISNSLALNANIPNKMNYGWSCEFSPDGTNFYGSLHLSLTPSGNNNMLFQWNLCAGSQSSIAASLYTVTSTNLTDGDLQLASNGKIYYACNSGSLQAINVINNPNSVGSACNYSLLAQSTSPKNTGYNLPNFMSSYFVQHTQPAPFTYTNSANSACWTASFNANYNPGLSINCSASGYSLNSVLWDFGDPISGLGNSSTLLSPVHSYPAIGTYTAQLILYYCGAGSDTLRQVVNILQPCIVVNSTSITCSSLGSATVQTFGSTGPFSYTWTPTAQTTSVATGLSPGAYTITVFDSGNNSTYTATTVFISLIPLSGSVNNSGSITCNGANTGTANVTNIAGGSGTQNYLWTNGPLTYTTAFTNNLSAGSWSITVTDALTGCTINNIFVISQPPALSLTLSSNTATNCTGTNIILTGTNTGGTPGYTYTWTAGPAGNTQTVIQITSGTYIYTLSSSDSNNCLISNTIAVNFIPNPTLSISDVSICPLQTGALTVSGASTYTWTGGSVGSTYTNSPVSSSQYSVTGSALGCTSIATASIVVMPVPNPFITTNSPRCEGSTLFLNAFGGVSYIWTGPNSFNSANANNNFTALSLANTGVYNVTVTAANSCTAATTKTLVVNPMPTLSVSGNTVCTSQALNLTANSSATTFVWAGPLSFTSTLQNPFITNPLVTNSGTYTIKATSALGCTNTAIAIASVVPPPSLTAQVSSYSLCSQAFNGSPNTITLTAGGANTYTLVTVPDMFNANPGGPISPLMAIPPNTGIASATLTGFNGVCSATTGLTFSIIPNPSVTVSSPTPVICAGETYTYTNQGANSYTWSSATPGFTTYNNGGVAVASPSIHSVFSVFGGSLGCNSASETSTITVNPLPLISLLPTSPTVCIGSKVNLIATGTSNSYTWSPSAYINSAYGNTVNASPNAQQSYTVVGSLNSCTSTAMITVSVLTLPSPTATVLKPAICLNETLTLQGFGGETYSWYGPNSIYYQGQTVNFVANSYVYTGTYTLTVADKNECKASAITSVTINSLPDGALHGTQMQGCVPFKSDFSFYSALASSSAIATQWTVDQKIFTTKTFSNEFKIPGNYTITGNFRDTLTNCLNSRSFVVEAYPVPVADFTYLPEKPIENIDEVIFTNTSTGEQQTKWNWFFVNNQGYRSENKNTNYLFTEAGLYPIAMMVTNTWGCSDTIVKALKVEADLTVYVPNVFTPNDDNLNEVFLPIVRAVKFYELMVFDRWGTKIFSTTNTEVGWDGSYGGDPCKVDVYVWKINLSSINGEMKTMTGSVLLSR